MASGDKGVSLAFLDFFLEVPELGDFLERLGGEVLLLLLLSSLLEVSRGEIVWLFALTGLGWETLILIVSLL